MVVIGAWSFSLVFDFQTARGFYFLNICVLKFEVKDLFVIAPFYSRAFPQELKVLLAVDVDLEFRFINLSQPLPNVINIYQPLSTSFINLNQPLLTYINLYQPLSIFINLYQPLSTFINLHQPLSAFINIYNPLSTFIPLYQH